MPVVPKPVYNWPTLPQMRILRSLYEVDKAEKEISSDLVGMLTRMQIAEVAGVSSSMTGNLGPIETDKVALASTSKRYGRRNLLERGFVKKRVIELDGGVTEYYYYITRAGIDEYERYVAINGEIPEKSTIKENA